MKNILITGMAGFIGSALARRLFDYGYFVCGVDSFNTFYKPEYKENNLKDLNLRNTVPIWPLNIVGDANALFGIALHNKIDTIVHLAAYPGVLPSFEYPHIYTDNNVTGTINVLEVCKKLNINLVFASSSSIYGNNTTPFSEDQAPHPISVYGQTKMFGEQLCKLYHDYYDLNITCLRFFTCYGPRQRPDLAIRKFFSKILKNETIELYGDGQTSRDYTYIDDITKGIHKAVLTNSGFRAINLGNSHPVSLIDLIKKLYLISGKDENFVFSNKKAGDVEHTYADITLAKTLLGWEPQKPFMEGLQETFDWVKTHV